MRVASGTHPGVDALDHKASHRTSKDTVKLLSKVGRTVCMPTNNMFLFPYIFPPLYIRLNNFCQSDGYGIICLCFTLLFPWLRVFFHSFKD